jgi:hypothetical protein
MRGKLLFGVLVALAALPLPALAGGTMPRTWTKAFTESPPEIGFKRVPGIDHRKIVEVPSVRGGSVVKLPGRREVPNTTLQPYRYELPGRSSGGGYQLPGSGGGIYRGWVPMNRN